MPDVQKSWWAPVWRGLVVDSEGKHYRRMKKALWLYLYLILHADRPTGTLVCKLATVSQRMGVPRRTLQGWLRLLRMGGYVSAEATGRSVRLAILKWKTLRRASKVAPLVRQMWHPSAPRMSR